jgi:hypothetical protein
LKLAGFFNRSLKSFATDDRAVTIIFQLDRIPDHRRPTLPTLGPASGKIGMQICGVDRADVLRVGARLNRASPGVWWGSFSGVHRQSALFGRHMTGGKIRSRPGIVASLLRLRFPLVQFAPGMFNQSRYIFGTARICGYFNPGTSYLAGEKADALLVGI